jgi:hypothetical protein
MLRSELRAVEKMPEVFTVKGLLSTHLLIALFLPFAAITHVRMKGGITFLLCELAGYIGAISVTGEGGVEMSCLNSGITEFKLRNQVENQVEMS